MYCLITKDKDGFDLILADPSGRLYMYDTQSNAKAAAEEIRLAVTKHLRTPVYKTVPIAFGLLTKDVKVQKSADEVLRLRRIVDTIAPMYCSHYPLPIEKVDFDYERQAES